MALPMFTYPTLDSSYGTFRGFHSSFYRQQGINLRFPQNVANRSAQRTRPVNGVNDSPFSERVYADYIEMVNQTLDSIPLREPDDFTKVIRYLQRLLRDPSSLSIEEIQLQEAFEPLLDYLDDSNSEEFNAIWGFDSDEQRHYFIQNIVKQCINRKINELSALTDIERLHRIEEQSSSRELRETNQELLRDRQPPAVESEAHVIPYERMLQLQYERWQEIPHRTHERRSEAYPHFFTGLFSNPRMRSVLQPRPINMDYGTRIHGLPVRLANDLSVEGTRDFGHTEQLRSNTNRYGFFSTLLSRAYESTVRHTVGMFQR